MKSNSLCEGVDEARLAQSRYVSQTRAEEITFTQISNYYSDLEHALAVIFLLHAQSRLHV